MTKERIIFSIILAIQIGCVEATRQNIVPAWTPFLGILGTILMAFMDSINAPPSPPGV